MYNGNSGVLCNIIERERESSLFCCLFGSTPRPHSVSDDCKKRRRSCYVNARVSSILLSQFRDQRTMCILSTQNGSVVMQHCTPLSPSMREPGRGGEGEGGVGGW